MDISLQILAHRYAAEHSGEGAPVMDSLYSRYVHEREESIIDTATSALSVSAFVQDGTIDYSAVTPQANEAFHLAYPQLNMDSLPKMSAEQLQGVANGWKGKLFEVLVRDRLNHGDWVGDLHLVHGQHAELAHSLVQPGWDVQIINPDGHVATELQLKASASLAYAKSALEHYSNIDVVTTHEAASNAVSKIVDSGMSDHDLNDDVAGPLDFDHGWIGVLHDIAPFIPFVIIATTEGRHFLMGKKTFEAAASHAIERAVKTGAAMGVGALVILLDGGLLSIPASIMTRLGIDRYQVASRAVKRLDSRLSQARALVPQHLRF